MSNTLRRQWEIVKRIPRHPHRIGTREIATHLKKQGITISIRTIQRDLNTLATVFAGLVSDGVKDQAGWCWAQDSEVHGFPAMNPPMAFAFHLMEALNAERFSPAVMQDIQPYFKRSNQYRAEQFLLKMNSIKFGTNDHQKGMPVNHVER